MMENINLLISKKEREEFNKKQQRLNYLGIVLMIWLMYLVFSLIQIEFALQEKNHLEAEMDQLSEKSFNQELSQQMVKKREKIKNISEIKLSNLTKQNAVNEILMLIESRAEITQIEILQTNNNKIETLINLTFNQNQNSSELIKIIKESRVFNQVTITSSNSVNGIKQIKLKLISDQTKDEIKR